MSSAVDQFFTDPTIARIIRKKARELVRAQGFTEADRDDIEQEFRLDLLRRSASYDPLKSSPATFANRVLKHRCSTLIEERLAACRNRTFDISLQAHGYNGDSVRTLEDYLDAQGNLASLHPHSREHEAADLRHDLLRALALLTNDQIDLCGRILSQNILEISRETGIPASTLYERLCAIRKRLAGIK